MALLLLLLVLVVLLLLLLLLLVLVVLLLERRRSTSSSLLEERVQVQVSENHGTKNFKTYSPEGSERRHQLPTKLVTGSSTERSKYGVELVQGGTAPRDDTAARGGHRAKSRRAVRRLLLRPVPLPPAAQASAAARARAEGRAIGSRDRHHDHDHAATQGSDDRLLDQPVAAAAPAREQGLQQLLPPAAR